MTLDKKLRELQPEIKERLDWMIKVEHYNGVRMWVEKLESRGYDVEYYKGVLKDGK